MWVSLLFFGVLSIPAVDTTNTTFVVWVFPGEHPVIGCERGQVVADWLVENPGWQFTSAPRSASDPISSDERKEAAEAAAQFPAGVVVPEVYRELTSSGGEPLVSECEVVDANCFVCNAGISPTSLACAYCNNRFCADEDSTC
jgi:hypothetical protein